MMAGLEKKIDSRFNPQDDIGSYISFVKTVPPSDSSEIKELFAVLQKDKNDYVTANKIVVANLPLVVSIAMKHGSTDVPMLDIIGQGNLALVTAVYNFDPSRGNEFSTYATHCIRGKVIECVSTAGSLLDVGSHFDRIQKFMRIRRRLRNEGLANSFSLSARLVEKIAEEMDITKQTVVSLEQRLAAREMSLNKIIVNEEGEGELLSFVAHKSPTPEETVCRKNEKEEVMKSVMRVLTQPAAYKIKEKDVKIFQDLYFEEEPLPVSEIAKKHRLTRERIYQIDRRLCKIIRADFLQLRHVAWRIASL